MVRFWVYVEGDVNRVSDKLAVVKCGRRKGGKNDSRVWAQQLER